MGLFARFKKATQPAATDQTVFSPVSGEIVALSEVDDPLFADGALGMGCGIRPEGQTVASPVSGVVSAVMEQSKHAIGLSTDDGLELLIHVGIDTVDMGGEGFSYHVAQGERVAAGQPLLDFSSKAIKAAGHDDTVMVLVSNSSDYSAVTLVATGSTPSGAPLLTATP